MLIVLINLIPLIQVIVGEWTVVQIVLLYWLESLLVLVLDLMIMQVPLPGKDENKRIPLLSSFTVSFALPFLLLQAVGLSLAYFFIEIDGASLEQAELGKPGLWWALLAMVVAHAFDLWQSSKASDCNRLELHQVLQVEVTARIVAIQIVMIVGAVMAILLGQPIWILLTLVLIKTVIDLAIFQICQRASGSRKMGCSLSWRLSLQPSQTISNQGFDIFLRRLLDIFEVTGQCLHVPLVLA